MNPAFRDAFIQVTKHHPTPVWLVGGPIRDELFGVPCKDWDFVCAHAERLARRAARALKAKFIVLDDQFKIYRLILSDHQTLDFAELQGKTITQDLSRRDFTINAMARRVPHGPLIDPFGGKKDLEKRLLRAPSEKVFREDPLRVLRAFRFGAQFQCRVDPKTLRWMKKHQARLRDVSRERVREELIRLWKYPGASAVLKRMDQIGLLTQLFPEMEASRRTAVRYYGKGGVLRHAFETVENLEWVFVHQTSPEIRVYLDGLIGGHPRHAWLKWAAFLHDVGKPATAKMMKGRLRFFEHEHVGATLTQTIGKRMRLSRQETHVMSLWVRHHMRTGSLAAAPHITDKALSRFFRDLGEEGVGMVLLSLADHYTYLKKSLWAKGKDPVDRMGMRLLSSYFNDRAKLLPPRVVDGHDLMKALGLKPGPIVGKLLEAVQDAQAEGRVKTKAEAIAFAKAFKK